TSPGLNLGFNTSEAPDIVAKNRKALWQDQNISSDWVAYAKQVHSNRVKVVKNGGTFSNTDALITQVPGLAMAIQVADCAAILLADTQSSTIAAVHAGWRGAVGDILPITLSKMNELGVRNRNIKAFISPCISVKNFEVGTEVSSQFPPKFVDNQSYKKPHIDLKAFLNFQLMKNGILQKAIETAHACTMHSGNYYSYRREGKQSGRMMAVIQYQMPAS